MKKLLSALALGLLVAGVVVADSLPNGNGDTVTTEQSMDNMDMDKMDMDKMDADNMDKKPVMKKNHKHAK